jgi:hypothetical protein
LLIDLAVLAGLFYLGGHLYMRIRGTDVIAEKRQEQALQRVTHKELRAEADSVVAATQERLAGAMADSARGIGELQALRLDLERTVGETQSLAQGIYRLSDVVLDMRQKAEDAVRQAQRDEISVREREQEVDSLSTTENLTYTTLLDRRTEGEQVRQALLSAQDQETYDPTGRFPDKTGLMLRRDVGDAVDATNLLLQQVFWKRSRTDIGLSVGFGLGSGESTSNKEVGLLLSRNLIHRRLALDFGAGLSQLTRTEGSDDSGAYASASLRLSPFYQERMHLGLGARASHDEVIPFLGLSLGRR